MASDDLEQAIRYRRRQVRRSLMIGDFNGYSYQRQVLRQLLVIRRLTKKRDTE